MTTSNIQGLVTCYQAGFYTVYAQEKEYSCKLRGKFKKKRLNEDLVAIGDKVFIQVLPDDSGIIEEILPAREYVLSPGAFHTRGVQTNPDRKHRPDIFSVFLCGTRSPVCVCWTAFW